MTKKLDLYDLKILSELDENSRSPASAIAKKVRLSKVAVNQRIKRLQKKGIIRSFITQIDYRKLGYNNCRVFYKLQNLSKEEAQKFYYILSEHKQIAYLGRIDGSYDSFLAIFYKNNEQLDKILHETKTKFGDNIKETTILPIITAQDMGRRYFLKKKKPTFVEKIVRGEYEKAIKLDEIDYKILQMLSQNARISIVELAEKINIDKNTAHYRIKKLIKEGIIQKFSLDFNNEAFGNSFFKVLVTLNADANEEEFLSFVSSYDSLIKVMKILGLWNIEMDFEVVNNLKMREILEDIKEKFGKSIQQLDSLFVYYIDKLNFYPF